jgi:coenzyme PQQ precursor peptide PqqA
MIRRSYNLEGNFLLSVHLLVPHFGVALIASAPSPILLGLLGHCRKHAARVLRSGVMQFKLLNMKRKETRMHWSTPTLVEICIGLEINGYLPAEF